MSQLNGACEAAITANSFSISARWSVCAPLIQFCGKGCVLCDRVVMRYINFLSLCVILFAFLTDFQKKQVVFIRLYFYVVTFTSLSYDIIIMILFKIKDFLLSGEKCVIWPHIKFYRNV